MLQMTPRPDPSERVLEAYLDCLETGADGSRNLVECIRERLPDDEVSDVEIETLVMQFALRCGF